MKRILLTVAISLVLVGNVFAAENKKIVENAVTWDSANSIYHSSMGVQTTVTRYTKAISLRQNSSLDDIAVMYKADSPGNINIKIELEQGYDKPGTESAYDANYITTDTVHSSLVDRHWKIATIDTAVMPYMRFKLTGQGSNNYGTVLQMKVIK